MRMCVSEQHSMMLCCQGVCDVTQWLRLSWEHLRERDNYNAVRTVIGFL
jgi:hypothetical protein